MTGAQIVARARSVLGWNIKYRLGAGGQDPLAITPATNGECDCSGFTAWCFSYARGPWNTDRIKKDAQGKQERFYQPLDVQPGDAVVYGGTFEKVPVLRRIRPGHIGIVVETRNIVGAWSGHPDQWRALRTVHCSMGNQRRLGRAVAETDSGIWSKRGIVVRLKNG